MRALQASAAIEISGLRMSYGTGAGRASGARIPVLEDVSLSIARGEFVSLLGPSGGGKSTLLNLLARLETPDAGTVRIHGGRRGASPPVAYMQQKDLLLPWRTLWDNILLAPELQSREERRRLSGRAAEMLTAYGLGGFEKAYPAQLSGGMRQRAALIRTLLPRPEILLLDEPFGALDAITRRKLQELLLQARREYGLTVLLVTHDVEEAVLLSDRVVLLSGRPGRIRGEVEVGIPWAFRAQSPETLRLKKNILDRLEEEDE